MKDLIYYPGFEVKNLNWLKFSLLYIDTLKPIIPDSGMEFLSDSYKKIMNETDLIRIHKPDINEGELATFNSIREIDFILRYSLIPQNYSMVLKHNKALTNTDNILEKWRAKDNQNYTIFPEKYSYQFESYCLENGIGHMTNEGLKVNREVALIYMSILANIIADSKGLSAITDYKNIDSLLMKLRTLRSNDVEHTKMNIAKGVIDLKLPANLRNFYR